MKVIATETYYSLVLKRNVMKGEELEVSQARYDVLAEKKFVKKVKEKIEVEITKVEPEVETTAKKTTRKKKSE